MRGPGTPAVGGLLFWLTVIPAVAYYNTKDALALKVRWGIHDFKRWWEKQ